MSGYDGPVDGDALVGRLGSARDLDERAKAAGALLRRHGVGSAADLLRRCFAYGLGGLSLRRLAIWAEERAVASLSDVALLKRLKASAGGVGDLVAELWAERRPEVLAGLGAPRRLLAVAPTAVTPPGDKREYWLVHTVFDLTALQVRAVTVTDRSQAEHLSRGDPRPGELRIADRGHAKVEELARVVQSGADFLLRQVRGPGVRSPAHPAAARRGRRQGPARGAAQREHWGDNARDAGVEMAG